MEPDVDEGRSSGHYTESTDPGLATLRSSCSKAAGTSDECHQEDNPDEDGVGHRSGEFRCDPSTLETWSCTVHQHRTGLVGDGRSLAGSSGRGSGANEEEEVRFQLMRIMDIPDRGSRLQTLRYLADAGMEVRRRRRSGEESCDDRPTPDSPQYSSPGVHMPFTPSWLRL